MAQFLFVFFILLSTGFVNVATANWFNHMLHSNPLVSSPRKLGMHQQVQSLPATPSPSPSPCPSTEPHEDKKMHYNNNARKENISFDQKAPSDEPKNEDNVLNINGQMIHLEKHHHHHAVDKSVAGGGVILGGLATTFLVAIFCYIKATGRHKQEIPSA